MPGTLARVAARSPSIREVKLVALGCELAEEADSRVRFDKDGLAFLCRRPQAGKAAKRYQIEDVRELLTRLEIKP